MASNGGDNKLDCEGESMSCPICNIVFDKNIIEEHVNKCLFLNTSEESKSKQKKVEMHKSKRSSSHFSHTSTQEKRVRLSTSPTIPTSSATIALTSRGQRPPRGQGHPIIEKKEFFFVPFKLDIPITTSVKFRKLIGFHIVEVKKPEQQPESSTKYQTQNIKKKPLAEHVRPLHLQDIVGQVKAFGPGSMLRSLIEQKIIPNMILWGPPGCGKTSLANVIANICKEQSNMRFVMLSATMAGINDVKEVVKIAKNEAQFKRQTVLFMDEIHRFNKLQQDTFLPHVENGTIILIGATTENPSFSLNNALLSRCRVVVMEKLSTDEVLVILKLALEKSKLAVIGNCTTQNSAKSSEIDLPQCIVEEDSLQWLAEVCDGDARVAIGALELAIAARATPGSELHTTGPAILSLEDIKNGIKRSHMVYDRQGEEHYNTVSAIHKSIRASDDNAALYWTTRALHGGEDPLYIARRLVRIACEDIGIADHNAIVEAVACLQGCQHVGMPECDVLLAQCAVKLARAPKSREVYNAMKRCQRLLVETKGPLPPVPLHLRNAPTKLMKQLGYGNGYNLSHKDESGLSYMPEGMEEINLFCDTDY